MRTLPRPLRGFLLVSAALTALCLGTELFCAHILHWGAPYTWPLTPPRELFYDLHGFYPKFAAFHTPAFFAIEPQYSFSYPAPMGVLYKLIYTAFPGWDACERAFLALLAATLLAGGVLVGLRMVRSGLATGAAAAFCVAAALLSYAFVFEAKQGNLEIFVFLLLAGGVWLFLHGKGYSSAACFALAGSMKLFPIVFLGLHLAQRRWRPLILAAALAPAITVVSLWLLGPDIAFTWHHLQSNLAELQGKIVLQIVPREIGFDHSLFSVVKRMLPPSSGLLRGYLLASAIAGTVLFFVRIRHLPVCNQLLALTLAAILLPPVSYDYTLIHLYLPLTLLVLLAVESARSALHLPGLTPMLLLLSAALSPLSELIHHGLRFGGQCRALILLTLFVLSLVYPLQPGAGERPGTAMP